MLGSSPLARGLPVDDGLGRGHEGIIPARAGFTCPSSPSTSTRTDHPRSRGVYKTGAVAQMSFAGSSPLARGLLGDRVASGVHDGIIPARAGFTPIPSHPIPMGSSPLARGLRAPVAESIRFRRIIPARAGFTWRS